MPHARNRHAMREFLRKLKFSRVVTVQGCRQSGKSFFARELLTKSLHGFRYVTFDRKADKNFAESNPETFLQQYKDATFLVIDEAQKVSNIFDAVKFEVDQNPRPGQYVLLGSTEFSRELQIRESLTGRISRLKIYPMNIAERLELTPSAGKSNLLMNSTPRFSRQELLKHLLRGGLPAIFSLREEQERQSLFQEWVNVTVFRDMNQFNKIKVDPELALDVLYKVAQEEEPTAAGIARALKRDTRQIQKILGLFEILFVVTRLNPHESGTGKSRYYLCDVGISKFLGASFERQLETYFLLEQLSQRSYRGETDTAINYYRNTKGSLIHFLLSSRKDPKVIHAIKIIDSESHDARNFELLKSFRSKMEANGRQVHLAAYSSQSFQMKSDKITSYAWECLG